MPWTVVAGGGLGTKMFHLRTFQADVYSRTVVSGGGLLVAVRPLFSPTQFQFVENGKVVGDMERSLWRETAELDLDDGRYSFYRDQVIGGDYVLEHTRQIRTRASGPSWWRSNLGRRSCSKRRPGCADRPSSDALRGVRRTGRRGAFVNPGWITGRAKTDLPRPGPFSTALFFSGFVR